MEALSHRIKSFEHASEFMVNLLSKLQAHATLLISKNLHYLFMYRSHVRQFMEGVVELRKGVLSPHLIGSQRLAQILKSTSNRVEKGTNRDMKLITTDPSEYYKRKDVAFVTEGDKLIIQLPVPLYKKSAGVLKVYQFQHVSVPYDTSKATNKYYTSIRDKYD